MMSAERFLNTSLAGVLTAVLTATFAAGASASEAQECRYGAADDGRTYRVCESASEVTLERALGIAAGRDDLVSALVAAEAREAQPGPRFTWYALAGGAADPTDGENATLHLGAGVRFAGAWRAQLDADLTARTVVERSPVLPFVAGARLETTARPILATLAYDLPSFGRLTPYVEAGAGMAQIETVDFGAAPAAPLLRAGDLEFALGAGAGLFATIENGLEFGLGYRFTHVPDAREGALSLHDVRMSVRLSL